MSSYEQLKSAQQAYAKRCRFVHLRFNRIKDAHIIEWLDKQPNATASLRELIEEKIKSETA